MNDAHLHLIVNHFPIIVPIVGLLVLIVGFLMKSDVVKRVAFGLFVFASLMSFPAMYTGEGAEEIVEKISDFSHDFIHEHEEQAEGLAIVNHILAVLSLLGFWANLKQKSFANYIAIAVLCLGLVGVYFAKMTGTSGGEIRHTEIRAGNAVSNVGEEGDDD